MVRTNTTEGQTLWQPGGAEEDSHFDYSDRHFRLMYQEEGFPAHFLLIRREFDTVMKQFETKILTLF